MNVRKFIAATARDALRKVRETLGPDAIILSNRGIPGGVEIMAVAARDMEMIVPPRDSLQPSGRVDAAAMVAPEPRSADDRTVPRSAGAAPRRHERSPPADVPPLTAP
ncbi:MAG TPA: flagellar biosynthesis protein FlhF, partial [Accumulibacter sp.]|nr:flagellar biosynthesis protein FlhF [Accumulibacter sp.]